MFVVLNNIKTSKTDLHISDYCISKFVSKKTHDLSEYTDFKIKSQEKCFTETFRQILRVQIFKFHLQKDF